LGTKRRLLESFRDAVSGVWYVWRTERNMRIHSVAALLAVEICYFGGIPAEGMLFTLSAVFAVLVMEMINTALEALVDLATEEYHPLAKKCKDVAAGAVLAASAYAMAVGVLVFLPNLGTIWANITIAARENPAGIAVGIAAVSALAALALR